METSLGLSKDVFLNNKAALTFDDVWMVPQYSEVESRDSVDLSTEIFKACPVKHPLISTCMDAVTESDMLVEMVKSGGSGMIHRGCTPDSQGKMFLKAAEILRDTVEQRDLNYPFVLGFAVSCGTWKERIVEFEKVVDEFPSNSYFVCLDVAHAHTKKYKEILQQIYEYVNSSSKVRRKINILAGTIATPEAAEYLYEFCDGIRVGVGSGSACTTRIQTGHGVPLFQSIIETSQICHDLGITCWADGGIRTSGDMVKALAVGADALVLGGVLTSTSASPAEKIYDDAEVMSIFQDLQHKQYTRITRDDIEKEKSKLTPIAVKYRGMASKDAQATFSEKRKSGYYVEGEAFEMPYTGQTSEVVSNFLNGVRSGLSYSGSFDLTEFRQKARFRMATFAGLQEAKPHGKK